MSQLGYCHNSNTRREHPQISKTNRTQSHARQPTAAVTVAITLAVVVAVTITDAVAIVAAAATTAATLICISRAMETHTAQQQQTAATATTATTSTTVTTTTTTKATATATTAVSQHARIRIPFVSKIHLLAVGYRCQHSLLNQLSHCLTHTPSLSQETHLNEAPNTILDT
jgi:hypothetical protein